MRKRISFDLFSLLFLHLNALIKHFVNDGNRRFILLRGIVVGIGRRNRRDAVGKGMVC